MKSITWRAAVFEGLSQRRSAFQHETLGFAL